MFKLRIINLLITATVAISIVAGLYGYSSYTKTMKNNFVREIPPHKLTADTVRRINHNDLYIAGFDKNFVYLSSRKGKSMLIKYDLKTLDTTTLRIKAQKDFDVYDDAEAQVVSGNIFLSQGFAGNIKSGALNTLELSKSTDIFPFYSAIPTSDTSFVVRYVNKEHENTLGTYVASSHKLTEQKILKKQTEGIFSTDGILLKTPDNKIVFVYYYRNQFIVTDQNLKLNFQSETIDTNHLAKIKVNKIWSTGQLTMSGPPLYVNREACANKDHLFIRSALRADNQPAEVWDTSTTIDVYSLKDGKYEFSFYLIDLDKDKLVSFKVHNKTLVALYHNFIYTFKLNF